MNSIKSLSGLASSLLLTAGLTRIAEKMDPMLQNNDGAVIKNNDVLSCEFSDYPCNFTAEAGQ